MQRVDEADAVAISNAVNPNETTGRIDFDLYVSLSIIRAGARREEDFCKDARAQHGAPSLHRRRLRRGRW
jgi:hypothetical protein